MSPGGETDDLEEVRALLVLDGLPEVGPATIRRLAEAFGGGRAALRAGARSFGRLAGPEALAARRDPTRLAAVDAALELAARRGVRTLSWNSAVYPDRLRHLADPPPVLFLRGRSELLGLGGVTVVGARRATARARDLATRLGSGLARAGIPVISGLALGVDGAAHRGAVSAGGPTVAVLGTGADVAYPRSHARLYEAVLRHGLLVSEFLPGSPALPHHFPRRNRILAALGDATVVVEAGARSGSLITVDHALDLGREVWAVPGPVEHPACEGSNGLLVEGARPLLSVGQLVSEALRHQGGSAAVSDGGEGGLDAPRPAEGRIGEGDGDASGGMAPADRVVLSVLGSDELSGDEIAHRSGLAVHEALARLTGLELRGVVRRLPGMRFRSVA